MIVAVARAAAQNSAYRPARLPLSPVRRPVRTAGDAALLHPTRLHPAVSWIGCAGPGGCAGARVRAGSYSRRTLRFVPAASSRPSFRPLHVWISRRQIGRVAGRLLRQAPAFGRDALWGLTPRPAGRCGLRRSRRRLKRSYPGRPGAAAAADLDRDSSLRRPAPRQPRHGSSAEKCSVACEARPAPQRSFDTPRRLPVGPSSLTSLPEMWKAKSNRA